MILTNQNSPFIVIVALSNARQFYLSNIIDKRASRRERVKKEYMTDSIKLHKYINALSLLLKMYAYAIFSRAQ